MSETTPCPGCQHRDQIIASLQQQIAELNQRLSRLAAVEQRLRELEGRLNQNSSNSSVPPSANPPQAPKPAPKQPTGRKSGAQEGHKPNVKLRLPPDRVRHFVSYLPKLCHRCQSSLPAEPQPADPEPTWHQVAELPELIAEVTEHQGHFRHCPCCGHLNHAPIPREVRRHSHGPNLCAALAYLNGSQHLSQRGLEEVVETLFEVPISVGAINQAQQQTSQALAGAHAEAIAAVRAAPSRHVDETGWKQAGCRRWLWAAVTQTVACFVIHARRGWQGLAALLGEGIDGLVTSDRWSAYNRLDLYQRQLCWAHLKRDFQAMVDRDNEGSDIGRELLLFLEDLFCWWHRVRDGTLRRSSLQRYISGQRPWFRKMLERGLQCGCVKTAAVCRDLLRLEPALWTFVRVEGVEPTNNAAERALRPAVLWRKRSGGCHSESGCRLVERLLTVVGTLRLQKRNVMAYLHEAIVAHRQGLPAPKLLDLG